MLNIGESDKTMCLFTGLQASGKSTFYAEHLADRFAHVSLDVLRTRNRERLAIEECLETGRGFVVDNTNPTRLDRRRYFDMIRGRGWTVIGCYFRSAIAECLERNARREGKKRLPDRALAAVSKKLEIPGPDEGFSRLWHVRIDEDNRFVVSPWQEDARADDRPSTLPSSLPAPHGT